MRVSGVALAIVFASALAGAGVAFWPVLQRRLPEPITLTLGGSVPAPGLSLRGWLERRAAIEAAQVAQVHHPDGVLLVPRAALGFSLDTERALAHLSRPRPPRGLVARLRVALGAPEEAIDVEPSYRFDAARAAAWLADVAPGLRREPVDARLDLSGHERVEARTGRELDLGASLSRLAAFGPSAEQLTLAFKELSPRIASSALANVDPSLVLSEYETDFAKRGGPRVKNIARAARYLDGTLMAPGEVWSFNRTVGPRTLDRGFVDAPVIVADEVEPGVGGGVCQVASTLFAAGVLGGLDVVQRRSHSRPSGYAPLGLDATVIDGEVDLQLRNPYPVPIIVHAYLPVPTRIRIEMLGAATPGKVVHSAAVTKSEDFYRRVARHPELRPDQVKRQQKGSPGYEVRSTVRTRYVDGSERVRHYRSTYYPVPEIYWVGQDVDPESLPALPERATRTELQGAGETVTPASFAP